MQNLAKTKPFHLKEFIKTITAIDEAEKINFTAHSRGTDVILTALRELIIEARASGKDPHRSLKLSNLVLLAPDIDASSQRLGNYDVSEVTERQKESLKRFKNYDIIFYSGEGGGLLEHSYLK